MDKNKAKNPEDLFKGIENLGTLRSAKDAETAAKQAKKAATIKADMVTTALDDQQSQIVKARNLAIERVGAVQKNHELFDLQKIVAGSFTLAEAKRAEGLVLARSATKLNIDTAASYGTVPDSVVSQFVNSAATKATGEARLEVARVLDAATGVTRQIANDKSIAADEVAKKAKQLLKVWHNTQVLNALFNRLFKQTLNRVMKYQDRLGVEGQNLAKKQVTLESISSSLVARQALVKDCLFETCVSGLALVNVLDRERKALAKLEKDRADDQDTPPQVYAQKIQEQEALIEITTKRLVDLKAFAIKLIGLYSVLGNTRFNVAVIKADVVFTRTNLMATLGLQLGLVVDIISTLRISKAARDIREAEAEAAEKVGVGSAALDEAGNQALTDVAITIRSLKATVAAAVAGIKNTHDNMVRVENMSNEADKEFGALFGTMAV